ncbi:copper resistance protein B [Sulfurimonas marina]|nr:copper resistance protein B [Sulfurimonas marina]
MNKVLLSTILTLGLATSSIASMDDDPLRATVMVDNLEYQTNDEKSLMWDSYAYVGYDIHKLYLYSEGEKGKDQSSADSENQLVYSRAISPFWDLQFGVDYDKSGGADQTWGVIGVQGLAPYFFETRAVILLGKRGSMGVRADLEYEALITQKLILTPSIAFSAYSKDNEEMEIGSGFSNIQAGMRLRYEIRREFAPYIGVEWNKNLGKTDDISPLNETYATFGLRVWF